jgi:hypothetical protein
MRAVLLASATAATLACAPAAREPTRRRLSVDYARGAARQPHRRSAGMYLSPRLLVRPKRSLPPLEFCRGIMPSQAANSRPDRNREGSATVAAMALAPMMPTPGTVASNRLTRLSRCRLTKRTSISRTPWPSCHSSGPQSSVGSTRELRESLLLMSNCLRQALDVPETLRCDDAEFGQVSAQCIDQHQH